MLVWTIKPFSSNTGTSRTDIIATCRPISISCVSVLTYDKNSSLVAAWEEVNPPLIHVIHSKEAGTARQNHGLVCISNEKALSDQYSAHSFDDYIYHPRSRCPFVRVCIFVNTATLEPFQIPSRNFYGQKKARTTAKLDALRHAGADLKSDVMNIRPLYKYRCFKAFLISTFH